jgi:hypothetical protein
MPEPAEQLAQADRAFIIAPAGFGKTYQIAKALSYCTDGKQLILTHTHSGVRSIREKLKKMEVPTKKYEVDTIAGWSLRLATAFPVLSTLKEFSPSGEGWTSVYTSATMLLQNSSLHKIIQATYKGLFVDEYQDCTLRQHLLILSLANILPCRILGDPLQGIFGFQKEDRLVDWNTDVLPSFARLEELTTPWRWNNANNIPLGASLIQLRTALENSQPFDLSRHPITWSNNDFQNQIKQGYRLVNKPGTVVAIQLHANQCNRLASMLKGNYGSMEPLDCEDLMKSAEEIEQLHGLTRVLNVIDFSSKCMTQVTTSLRSACSSWEKGKLPLVNERTNYPELINALNLVATCDNLSFVSEVLPKFRSINGSYLYRGELWYEMLRTLRTYLRGGFDTLKDAAWNIRNITREKGRQIDHRVVSRTLLVKGLEFDHAVVLNADILDKNNLYVAMTRGAKSLTVMSSNPIIQKSL